MASNWEIGLLERLQSRGLLDFTEEDQSDFYAESTTNEEKMEKMVEQLEESDLWSKMYTKKSTQVFPQYSYMAGKEPRRGTGQLVPEAGLEVINHLLQKESL